MDRPFNRDASPLCAAMARGHLMRTGHELVAHHEYVGDGIFKLVRTCCK